MKTSSRVNQVSLLRKYLIRHVACPNWAWAGMSKMDDLSTKSTSTMSLADWNHGHHHSAWQNSWWCEQLGEPSLVWRYVIIRIKNLGRELQSELSRNVVRKQDSLCFWVHYIKRDVNATEAGWDSRWNCRHDWRIDPDWEKSMVQWRELSLWARQRQRGGCRDFRMERCSLSASVLAENGW